MARLDLTLPPGRFVSGSLTEKVTTDMDRKPIEPEKQSYDFGMAFDKIDPTTGQPGAIVTTLNEILQFAAAGYQQHPGIVARINAYFQTFSGFSMKVSDGDKPSARTNEVNPNFAGKYILWFSTMLDVKTCDINNSPIDSASVKRGWFCDMTASVAINGRTDHNAGIYLNPEWIRLVAEGDEIVGGRSADSAFNGTAAAPAALPPGARPLGSTPATPAGLPGAGQAPATPAGLSTAGNAPQPVMTAPAAPSVAPVVGHGVPTSGAVGTGVPGIASPTEQHPPHPGIMTTPAPVAAPDAATPGLPTAVGLPQ
jgi:hypothetical protein